MLSLLDTIVESGIKYVVFSSSAATFGEPKYVPIDEKHPQEPINPYGTTKLIGEQILKDYEKHMACIPVLLDILMRLVVLMMRYLVKIIIRNVI